MLYDSIVLRRTKDILTLPGQEERIRELQLSSEERTQYEYTTKILDRYIRQQVGEHEVKSKFGLFQAHLQLRILCNHGTHQKLFSWKKRSLMDEKEAFLAELGLNAERPCAVCRQPRPIINSNNSRSDFVEKCAHILCAECLDDYDNSQGGTGSLRHCPLCQSFGKSLHDAATRFTEGSVDENRDVVMQDAGEGHDGDKDEDTYFSPDGHSTKIKALVNDVKEALGETVRDDDGKTRKTKRFAATPKATARLHAKDYTTQHHLLMLDSDLGSRRKIPQEREHSISSHRW